MTEAEIKKLYYSIGEVSELLGVVQHVLRYWETEFKELAPRKNRAGKRLYRESDIETLRQIKRLLYEERYTIEGARRQLRMQATGYRHQQSAISNQQSAEDSESQVEKLQEIRKGLLELKDLIVIK